MSIIASDDEAMFEDTAKFSKALKKNNLAEIFGGVLGIIIFLFYAYFFRDKPILISIGSVFIAAGILYIIIYIFRNRMIKGEVPPKEKALDYFEYWIGWYQKTQQLGRKIFWWYLLPLAPGYIAFTIGMAQSIPDKSVLVLTLLGSISIIIGGVVYWLNRYYASRKLQARIDNLSNWLAKHQSP